MISEEGASEKSSGSSFDLPVALARLVPVVPLPVLTSRWQGTDSTC